LPSGFLPAFIIVNWGCDVLLEGLLRGRLFQRRPFYGAAIFVFVPFALLPCVAFRIYLFFGVGLSCVMVFYFRHLSNDEPKLQTGDENDRSFQAEGMSMRPHNLFCLAFAWDDTVAWVLSATGCLRRFAISIGKHCKFWSACKLTFDETGTSTLLRSFSLTAGWAFAQYRC